MAHLLSSVRSHPPAAGIVGMAPTPGLHVVAAFHRGPLGPLQRLIQPDLGLLFMEREVVRTTYVAFLNLGLTREILSGSSLSLDNLGPTCGTRWTTSPRRRLAPREAGRRRGSTECASEAQLKPVQYRDLKSAGFSTGRSPVEWLTAATRSAF